MKKFLSDIFLGLIGILLFCTAASTSMGIADASGAGYLCNSNKTRIEYVWPFYKWGCWLGEVPK